MVTAWPSFKRGKLFLPMLLGLIVINCIAFFYVDYLPFADLPNHLAEATIFKYRNNPCLILNSVFSCAVTWWRPDIAHIVIASLFPSVEMGTRLLYLLYVASIPLLAVFVTRQCAGSLILSLLSFLVLWNFSAIWGFTGFTLAIPIAIALYCLEMRIAPDKPGLLPESLLKAVGLVILYWFHVLPFLFMVFFYALTGAWRCFKSSSWRNILLTALPLIPSVTMMLIWVSKGGEHQNESTWAYLAEYYSRNFLPSLAYRIADLPSTDGKAIYCGITGRLTAFAFAAPIAISVIASLYYAPLFKARLSWPRLCTLLFIAAALACYLFLPAGLPGFFFLHERFAVFVLFGLVSLLLWVFPRPWLPCAHHAVCVTVLCYSLLWLNYFSDFNRSAYGIREVLKNDGDWQKKRLGAIITEYSFRGRPAFMHFNNYHIVWNKAATPTRIMEYRFGAIRGGETSLPKYDDWIGLKMTNIEFLNAQIFTRQIAAYGSCDMLLVRGGLITNFLDRRSDYSCLQKAGAWALYEKTVAADKKLPCENPHKQATIMP